MTRKRHGKRRTSRSSNQQDRPVCGDEQRSSSGLVEFNPGRNKDVRKGWANECYDAEKTKEHEVARPRTHKQAEAAQRSARGQDNAHPPAL